MKAKDTVLSYLEVSNQIPMTLLDFIAKLEKQADVSFKAGIKEGASQTKRMGDKVAMDIEAEVRKILREHRALKGTLYEDSVIDLASEICHKFPKTEDNPDGYEGKPSNYEGTNLAGNCPDCGNLLVYQEGCFVCSSCGYTKC